MYSLQVGQKTRVAQQGKNTFKICSFIDLIPSHVCGLDVHKKNVETCIITPETKEVCTFSTMTDDFEVVLLLP